MSTSWFNRQMCSWSVRNPFKPELRPLTVGRAASGSTSALVQFGGNDWLRRVLPVAPRPREGPLTEQIAGVQPWRRERVLVHH